MCDFNFQYGDYRVLAQVECFTKQGFVYVSPIEFDVFNSQGEDVTCDISGFLTMNIHQHIVELAKAEIDPNTGGCHEIQD